MENFTYIIEENVSDSSGQTATRKLAFNPRNHKVIRKKGCARDHSKGHKLTHQKEHNDNNFI